MPENSMLNNNLLLYFLAGAGRGVGGAGSLGDTLGGAVQQQIGAESQSKTNAQYMKMLQGMLAAGGKINLDKDNINIKAPVGSLNSSSGQAPSMSAGTSGLNPSSSSPDVMSANLAGLENQPQAQPADIQPIPREMLAGMTPQNVAQALSGATGVNSLMESKISDIANRQLKERELNLAEETAKSTTQLKTLAELRQWQELMRESPLEVPGLGKLSFDQWKALDTNTKAYSYYAYDANQHNEKVMPYNEWKTQSDSKDIYDIFQLAEKDSKFKDFFFRQKKAGATRISLGEKVAERRAMGEIQGEIYFNNPDWTKDVEKNLDSGNSQEMIYDASKKGQPEVDKTRKNIRIKTIESKILAGKGTIKDIRYESDGKTMVWTVKWPSKNETEEIRYAVRD